MDEILELIWDSDIGKRENFQNIVLLLNSFN